MCDTPAQRIRRRLLGAAANLAVLFCGTVVALCLGELLVRCFVGQLPELMDKSDPVFGARYYRHAVGARYVDGHRVDIKINGEGFYSPDYPFGRPTADTKRVVFVGDSFTAATEVPLNATFHQRTATALTGLLGHPVQGISLGVGGLSTGQECLIYQTEAAKYEADVVVLAFFPGNDVVDNDKELSLSHRPFFTLDADGKLQALPFQPHWNKRTSWLRQSALYRYQKVVLNRFGAAWREKHDDEPLLKTYTEPTEPEWQRAWKITEALLVAIRDLAQQRNQKLLMVIIPERYQVNPAEWQALLARFPRMRETTYDLEYPQRHLNEFCASHDIPVLDVLPAFKLAAKYQPLYNKEEGHLNAAGHVLLAQQLTERLATSGWLGDPVKPSHP